LESCAQTDGSLQPFMGETSIFIQPPYKFNWVDKLITNFHLPQSSLLFLVSALASSPNKSQTQPQIQLPVFTEFQKTSVGRAYLAAIQEKYRFFSFGDAMLIE
ncbi:MAG: S-adenosylmethionine:tRNA ribosyltransferase-isomerase, partial [Parcubacteria group bacterium GW2011_GWF2_44_8]